MFPTAPKKDKKKIEAALLLYKEEFKILHEENRDKTNPGSLYNQDILLPCLFNSGCVIGKRGITGITIEDGNISLNQWFNTFQKNRYFKYHEASAKQIENTDYFKMVYRNDQLDYIFSRIHFFC